MTRKEALKRVIWSADVKAKPEDKVTDVELMFRYLDQMPDLQIVKIDRAFGERNGGLSILDQLRERGLLVFDDAKFIEVPTKLRELASIHVVHKPWMMNVMAGGCSSGLLTSDLADKVDGLRQFAEVCLDAGVRPCGVTVLTSKTAEVIAREFNQRTSVQQVIEYVGMLKEFGFTDVVCSVSEVEEIRRYPEFNALALNVPGVKMPGTENADQARSDTPANTLLRGADRLVVGRDITLGDPAANLERIIAHLCEGVS